MNNTGSQAGATTSHAYSKPGNPWFAWVQERRAEAFGRGATVQQAVAQIGKLRDQIADGQHSFRAKDLNNKIEDYFTAHIPDIKDKACIGCNKHDVSCPFFLLDSLRQLAAHTCPDKPGIQRRLRRTQWINLGSDTKNYSPHIQKLISNELTRCGGYNNPKSSKWMPIVVQINVHVMTIMMRWTGTNLLFVLPGTLGNTLYLDKNTRSTRPANSIRSEHGLLILMELLCSNGYTICQEHHTAFLEKQLHEADEQGKSKPETLQTLAQACSSLNNPYIQILILEPGRQKDIISCGIIALHDLFVFINDGGMRGIKGKQVYFIDSDNIITYSGNDTTAMKTVFPQDVPGCELYKMTAYPPDLLRPSQSLSTFRKEIEELKLVSKEYQEKAEATEAHILSWTRPSASSPPEQSHDLNLFMSYYMLDAIMYFSGGESSIKNIGRPS